MTNNTCSKACSSLVPRHSKEGMPGYEAKRAETSKKLCNVYSVEGGHHVFLMSLSGLRDLVIRKLRVAIVFHV